MESIHNATITNGKDEAVEGLTGTETVDNESKGMGMVGSSTCENRVEDESNPRGAVVISGPMSFTYKKSGSTVVKIGPNMSIWRRGIGTQ